MDTPVTNPNKLIFRLIWGFIWCVITATTVILAIGFFRRRIKKQ